MNIAIDGPAGAGKSTVAKLVAKKRGAVYVDTGAMYRAMALCVLREGADLDDPEQIAKAAGKADITLRYLDGIQHVYLNGEDVTHLIRTGAVTQAASRVSVVPEVRSKLVLLQQKLARSTPVVMDGRDIGTVVLPDAELKVYLTASARVRAERRWKELAEKAAGDPAALAALPTQAQIEREIRERDERDMNRKESPLRRASDAVLVDSSGMAAEEVAERILTFAKEKQTASGKMPDGRPEHS